MGFFHDRSRISLIISNIITIIIALIEGWELSIVICIYWFQSVVIGMFTIVRLLDIKYDDLSDELKTKIVEADEGENGGKPFKLGEGGKSPEKMYGYVKIILAGFFTVHYGLFHYGYYEFINPVKVLNSLGPEETTAVFITLGVFFLNHMFSFLYNKKMGAYRKIRPMEVMVAPYHRIMPMHMTIIFGTMIMMALSFLGFDPTKPVLVFFLVVKTFADSMMHTQKHNIS